jgi:hypothetical protein
MRLSTLVWPFTLSTMLALAGCKKKEEPAAKPTTSAPARGDGARSTAGGTAQPTLEGTPPTETASDDLRGVPPACAEYKAGIERLSRCEVLPLETREVLKQAFQQAAAGWANAPDKTVVGDACKRAVEALQELGNVCM